MSTLACRLMSNIRRFLTDRRGNIAILFGLSVVPIFGIMGVALDYSWANMERTRLQAAADNTLLALSKMPQPMSDADLLSNGSQIFSANIGKTPLQYDLANADEFSVTSASGGKIQLDIHTKYPLTLGAVLTQFFGTSPTIPIGVHSQVQWGNTRLRVALVLDNSISMNSSGKIDALKTATTNLLKTLKDAAQNTEDVYVSIITFSTGVKLDPATYSSHDEWIDFTAWDQNHGSCSVSGKKPKSTCESSGSCTVSGKTSQSSCTSSGTCSISGNNTQSNCQNAHACSISGNNTQTSCQNAHVCTVSGWTTQTNCTSHGGSWVAGVWSAGVWTPGVWTAGVWTPADHSTWNGCLMDRGLSNSAPDTPKGLDQSIDGVTSDNTTQWPADPNDTNKCAVNMVGLTNNWTTLNDTMTNFVVGYSTNQPIGLVWGWQALKGTQGPLSVPAKDPNYAYSDTIILMSDGLNTQDRWYSLTNPSNPSVDKRMYDSNGTTGTCKYVKDNNISVFAIQVNTDNEATSTLLQNCASNSSMFWELKNANDLITVFDQIGSALANIHLSQ